MSVNNKESGLLPEQSLLKATILRPGRQADIVVATDLDEDYIDVRPSIVYEAVPERVLLSQPFPPLGRSKLGQQVEITFLYRNLANREMDWVRVGYQARLIQLINDYPLGGGRVDNVVAVSPPERLERSTVRLYYRVVPGLDSGIKLWLLPDRNILTVLDISVGGVRFSHPPAQSFRIGDRLEMELQLTEPVLPATGEVVRSSVEEGLGRRRLGVTAIKFVDMAQLDQLAIGRAVNDISRRQLAKRSGLYDGV